MKIELEFYDGSTIVMHDVEPGEEWQALEAYEHQVGEIVSGWRDDEPWFGRCTDMRPGVP